MAFSGRGRRAGSGLGPVRAALSAVLLAAVLAGCSTQVRHHGYAPDDAALGALQIGTDTRETVASAVGRPGTMGVLSDSDWYYVGSRWEQFAHRPPVEVEREVVALRFDSAGRLSNIERFGLQDGQVVPLSRRVTEDRIQGVTLIAQLLRNVGQFTADQVFD